MTSRSITFCEYKKLPEDEQTRIFQGLNPYEEPTIFDDIKTAFLKAHPKLGPVENIFIGFGNGLGAYNVISVRTKRGEKKRVPSKFMGATVLKKND